MNGNGLESVSLRFIMAQRLLTFTSVAAIQFTTTASVGGARENCFKLHTSEKTWPSNPCPALRIIYSPVIWNGMEAEDSAAATANQPITTMVKCLYS